jgi:hypothetical protein
MLTSALDGDGQSEYRSGRITPENNRGIHWTEGLMALRAGVDVMGKRKITCSYRESIYDLSAFQPLAQSPCRLSCRSCYLYVYKVDLNLMDFHLHALNNIKHYNINKMHSVLMLTILCSLTLLHVSTRLGHLQGEFWVCYIDLKFYVVANIVYVFSKDETLEKIGYRLYHSWECCLISHRK